MNKLIKEKQKRKLVSGFTLIELLVVMAIISLLSSIIMVSLNSAREKSRDAKRLADLHQFQIAIEMYNNDHGEYPKVTCLPEDSINDGWAGDNTNGDYPEYEACQTSLKNDLVPYYIREIPLDPINKNSDNTDIYWYGSYKNGKGYKLLTWLEASTNNGKGCLGLGYYCIGENYE